MSAQNRHPQETWRLIKYLCGRRGQELICAQGLAIPVLKSVARSRCFSDPDRKPESDEVFLTAAAQASYVEWPADPKYRDQLKTHLEEIFKLGQPAEPALAKVQTAWKSNQASTAFREDYSRAPWNTIAVAILIPLGIIVVITGVFWWRRRPGRLAFQEELAGMAMIGPWVIGFVGLTTFPIVLSLLLAFTRWSGLVTLDQADWVGLDNFRELVLYDETFRRALFVTAFYALLAVPSSQILALIAAALLNHDLRGIGVFRAIWYLPSVLAGVGMAIMWKWVFHHEHGLLNLLLEPVLGLFDCAPPRWLERDARTWGVPAFALINLWMIGGTMMIYLAGLKGIPRDLYEAAEIDGATGPRRFWNVTLPMLSPVIFFNVIIAIIASFQIFTQVFVMTGGGPGTATHFYVYYVYKKAFDLHEMGYASAMAWLLFVIVLILTLLIMRGSRRYVYYEALKA
jgi:multiple sugar transport system permease protein